MEPNAAPDVAIVPEGVLARLRASYRALPEAEQRVADFVAEHPADVVQLAVKSLAQRIGVSEATIVRCCQSLGYRGLRELKFALAAETVTPLQRVAEEVSPDDSVLTIAHKVLQFDIQAIADTLAVLDNTVLEQAVQALLDAPRIEFYGVGSSIPVVMDASYRFLRSGLPATVVTDPYVQLVSAARLSGDDVAFAVSHSGRSTEIFNALRTARGAGATTILLCSHAHSPLAEHADIQLITAGRAVVMHTESVASRIAHLCVIDALYVAVSMRRLDATLDALARSRTAVASAALTSSPKETAS